MTRTRTALAYLLMSFLVGSAPAFADEKTKSSSSQDKATSALPNGASSLQETYEDWQVACVQQGQVKKCSLAQIQADPQSRQRVISVEIAPSGEKAEGIMILPFGLDLDKGVTLEADDDAGAQSLRFRTCLPLGCVVAVNFDASTLTRFKKASLVKIKAEPDGGGKTIELSISLKGFNQALERTANLIK